MPEDTTNAATPPLYVSDPEAWLKETVGTLDLVCILFFRGSWCKYDRFYLRELGKFYKSTMQESGEKVTLIAWTSEGTAGAKKADDEWKLTSKLGFSQVIGDETNALAKFLQEDEVLGDLRIIPVDSLKAPAAKKHSTSTYPNGVVLPSQVWYAHHGNLVSQWTVKAGSLGGPGRPAPAELWAAVLKRKHALDHGSAIMPAHGEMKLCAEDVQVNTSHCSIL
jgi:hypothetical protein